MNPVLGALLGFSFCFLLFVPWLLAKQDDMQVHIEALEIKAATWLALAGPMWVGDESEGHFVCLACNQAGADDGGTRTIQHLPDCEYAAALAAEERP